ncbi:hypothetical protein Trydic_g9741 [Trypoxylus dichotomus]
MYFKLIVVCVVSTTFLVESSLWYDDGHPPWYQMQPYRLGGMTTDYFGHGRSYNYDRPLAIRRSKRSLTASRTIGSQLNNDLKAASTALRNQAGGLMFDAGFKSISIDIAACNEAFNVIAKKIWTSIDALDIDVGKTELAKNISQRIGLLYAQVEKYETLLKGCKAQFSSFTAQLGDLQDCATIQEGALDQQVLDERKGISADLVNLQSKVHELIDNVTVEVNALIDKAGNDFDNCLNSSA